jgi:hypothetical protein
MQFLRELRALSKKPPQVSCNSDENTTKKASKKQQKGQPVEQLEEEHVKLNTDDLEPVKCRGLMLCTHRTELFEDDFLEFILAGDIAADGAVVIGSTSQARSVAFSRSAEGSRSTEGFSQDEPLLEF